jgi:hypothetical protein
VLPRGLNQLTAESLLQAVSPMRFPSQRSGNRAVQAVEIMAPSKQDPTAARAYTYTFCLERIDVGPYKVGVQPPRLTLTDLYDCMEGPQDAFSLLKTHHAMPSTHGCLGAGKCGSKWVDVSMTCTNTDMQS